MRQEGDKVYPLKKKAKGYIKEERKTWVGVNQ